MDKAEGCYCSQWVAHKLTLFLVSHSSTWLLESLCWKIEKAIGERRFGVAQPPADIGINGFWKEAIGQGSKGPPLYFEYSRNNVDTIELR